MGRKRKYSKEIVEYIQQRRGISYRAAISFIKRNNIKTLEDAQRLLEEGQEHKSQEQKTDIKRIDPTVNEEELQENDFIAELINENETEDEHESENEGESEQEKVENNNKFLRRLVEVSHRIAYRLIKSLFSVQFERDEQDLNELIEETVDIWVEELQNWGVQVDSNLIVLLVIYASYLSRLKRIEKRREDKEDKNEKPQIVIEEPKPNTKPIEMHNEDENENENEIENDPYAELFKVDMTPGYIGK